MQKPLCRFCGYRHYTTEPHMLKPSDKGRAKAALEPFVMPIQPAKPVSEGVKTKHKSNGNSVLIISQASRMLAEANTIQQAKELKDLALTAADWAKRKGLGKEAVHHARTYALLAERKMGEMLAVTERAKGAMGIGKSAVTTGNHTPKLSDLGISKRESVDAQLLASLSDREFEAVRSGERTLIQVKREHKESRREARRKQNHKLVVASSDPLLLKATFSTIVIDPPWDWGDEGDADQMGRSRPTYETIPFEKLIELPVAKLADFDCHLYLWITNRSLPKGFQLLETWGFRYVTCLTWCKPSIGLGNYFRGQTEHVLFAVKGSQPLKRRDVGTWFAAPRGNGHSAKPIEAYALIESCSPGPYLEMFARCPRDGWTVWGAEIEAV